MVTILTAGIILIALAVVVFILEGVADLRGYGQMVAWMRITLFFLGLIAVLASFIQNR